MASFRLLYLKLHCLTTGSYGILVKRTVNPLFISSIALRFPKLHGLCHVLSSFGSF